jgi:AraC-like DNA-binding protein
VLTAWTGTLLRAAAARGLDLQALLSEAGLDLDVLADPDRRVPLEESGELWRAVTDAAGDDAFGIEVSRHVRPSTFNGLGHAFLSSPTLRSALERVARYTRVTSDLAVGSCRVDDSEIALVIGWREAVERPAHQAVDAAVATLVRSARLLLGPEVSPTRVELERHPPQDLQRFAVFFGCPIRYDAEENVLAFDRELAERPVPGGLDRLAAMTDEALSEYLIRLQPDTAVGKVREILIDVIDAGEPDIVAIAAELGISSQTLQQLLTEEDATFRDVVRDTRKALADALLAADDPSIADIARRLGFSETSAFSRAYRGWTGHPPSHWREVLHDRRRRLASLQREREREQR